MINRFKNAGNVVIASDKLQKLRENTIKTKDTIKTEDTIIEDIALFIFYFIVLLVVGVSFDRIAKNKTGFSREVFTYAFVGIFISISILIFIFGYKKNENSNINIFRNITSLSLSYRVGFLVIAIFTFIALIYFYNVISYIFIVFFILIVIVGLAIIFNLLYDVFEKSIRNTEIKFIIEFIFFIPCLFNDILKWGLEQIHMAPYLTYVLLLIEIILILVYSYSGEFLEIILNGTINAKNKKVLQREPFYINKGNRAVIATSNTLSKTSFNSPDNYLLYPSNNKMKPDGGNLIDFSTSNPYIRDYSLSMWINMNPQSIANNEEIDILSYFYTDDQKKEDQYKPKIVYTSSSNSSAPSVKDVYRIYFTGGKNDSPSNNRFEIHVPNQRWNHFVFNYVNGKMAELWVNGVMERVMKFTGGVPIPQYDPTDQIVIGSLKKTGTNGAICNVVYFDKSISSYQIVNMYNYGMLGLKGINSYPQ